MLNSQSLKSVHAHNTTDKVSLSPSPLMLSHTDSRDSHTNNQCKASPFKGIVTIIIGLFMLVAFYSQSHAQSPSFEILLSANNQNRTTTIYEGDAINFVLTSSTNRASAHMVRVNVVESTSGSDVLLSTNEGMQTFDVPMGSAGFSASIPTKIDYASTADSSITLTVTADTGYTVGTNVTLTYNVKHLAIDPPVVSISAPDYSVNVPADANFELSISPSQPHAVEVTVNVNTSDTDFLMGSTGNRTTSIPAGNTTSIFTVQSKVANEFEAALFTATIQNSPNNYTVGTNNSATMYVNGAANFLPTVGVRIKNGSESSRISFINSGDSVELSFGVGFEFDSRDRKIRFLVEESNSQASILAPSQVGIKEIDLPSANIANGVSYMLATTSSSSENETSIITVSVIIGKDYIPSTSFASVQIVVDPPPVSIETVQHSINAGDTAKFVVTIPYTFSSNFDVTVNISSTPQGINSEDDKTVTILQNTLHALVNIATNTNTGMTGSIIATVAVPDAKTYRVSTNNQATIVVNSNVLQEIGISRNRLQITESSSAKVVFTISGTEVRAQLTAKVLVFETNDMISSSDKRVHDVNVPISVSRSTEVELEIAVNNDEIDEVDSQIWAVLQSDPTYQISTNQSRTFITVTDDDLPTISIEAENCMIDDDTCWILENTDAMFKISAQHALQGSSELEVMVNFTETGRLTYENTGQLAFTFSSGEFEKSKVFSIIDDPIDEDSNDSITATIIANSAYTIDNMEASVQVRDNDGLPQVSLERVTSSVEEKADAPFIIRVWPLQTTGLIVYFHITETGGAFNEASSEYSLTGENMITVSANTMEFQLSIPTDDVSTNNGSVTITLVKKSTYDTLILTRTIEVLDIELPEVTISANSTSNLEGLPVIFAVTVDPAPTTNLSVQVNISENNGDNILSSGSVSEIVVFNSTNTNELIAVDTVLNGINDVGGTLTARIQESSTYLRSGDGSVAVVVTDNDTAQIAIPLINISAGIDVDPGEPVIFTLTANQDISAELIVNILISQTGNVLDNNPGTRTVTFSNSRTAMHTEATSSGNEGSITAEIEADTRSPLTYALGTELRATIGVLDEVPSIISILTPENSIESGKKAYFLIVADPSPRQRLTVQYNFNQIGNFLFGRVPKMIEFAPAQSRKTLGIQTRNDLSSQNIGKITLTIIAGMNYKLGTNVTETISITNVSASGARVSVADVVVNAIFNLNQENSGASSPTAFGESLQPIVSIQALEHVVTEGQPVQLLIKTHVTNSNDLIVNLIIDGGQSFVNLTSPTQQVQISHGQSNTLFSLATIDDARAEDDETMIVSIAEGEGYSIADSPLNQASVLISDANDRAEYNQRLSAANLILIPELMATTGVQSYQTMSNRVQLAFNNEEQFLFEVGGQSNPTEILTLSGQTLNDQTDLMDMLRDDTEIAIRLTSDNSILNNTTAWLKSENQNIYNIANTNSNSWTGEFYTGNFGIDTQLDSGLLLGIATSTTENDISYTATSDQAFEYTASYTGFNPYIALSSPALNTQVWVSSNVSSGYIDVDSQHQRTHRLNSNYSTITFGGESQLFSLNDLPFNGTSEFNLTGQGWFGQQNIYGDGRFTSDFSTKSHHVQISLAGSHEIEIAEIGTFTPNLLIGIRDAKKDADTVMGVEFGLGALYFNNFGLTLEGFGRGFKGSKQQDYTTTFTSTLTYNPNHDNTGSQLTISPSWGQSTGPTQLSLWQSNLNRENELFDQYTNGLQISSEYSYGISLLDGVGVLTPFSAINFSESDLMSFDIGNRIEIGTDSSFAIKGTREVRNNNITNNKFQLQGTVRW